MAIEFDCKGCDRHIRVRDDMAGKHVKCPECEKILTVPDEADQPEERPTAVRSSRPEPRRAAPSRPLDDEDEVRPSRRQRDDEDDRDRDRDRDRVDQRFNKKKKVKKGGGSSLPLILGLGGGVLGLGLVGFLLWFFLSGGGGGGAVTAYIPGNAQGFMSVRLADLWKLEGFKQGLDAARQKQPGASDPFAQMKQEIGLEPQDIERFTVVGESGNDKFWIVIETVSAYDQELLKGKLTGATEETSEGKKYFSGTVRGGGGLRAGLHFAGSRMVVYSPNENVLKSAMALSAKPRESGPMDDGIALMSSSNQFVAAFRPPPEMARFAQQGAKAGPMAQFAPLADFTSGSVSMSASGRALNVRSSLKFPDAAKASAAKIAADAGVKMAQGFLVLAGGDPKTSEVMGKALDSFKADVSGSSVNLRLNVEDVTQGAGMNLPIFGMRGGGVPQPPGGVPQPPGGVPQPPGGVPQPPVIPRPPGGRPPRRPPVVPVNPPGVGTRDSNANLKQIVRGWHDYHDKHGSLPTDIVDKDGKPLLSWRVAILPYIGQADLYSRFKLDEAWNSPNNLTLVQQMPAVFQHNRGVPNMTSYLRLIGQGTLFPDAKAKTRITDITDGTSNTIALVDSSRYVNWTSPGDLEVRPTLPTKFGLRSSGGSFLVALCDGTVKKVNATVSDKTLQAAITPKGNEILGPDW